MKKKQQQQKLKRNEIKEHTDSLACKRIKLYISSKNEINVNKNFFIDSKENEKVIRFCIDKIYLFRFS